ncbi:MAG: thiosulfohydrolase SoxB [Gammaproteobacteria bacterium]|nr:thiosulfohydrolase SoxB [Gammaproteobacteria bacterium]
MSLSRREFVRIMGLASAAGMLHKQAFAQSPYALYDVPTYGNVRLLHFTDCHAQLLPVYYREPNVNMGLGDRRGKAPHIVGKNLLREFGIAPDSIEAHAFTYLDFADAARRFGKVGGFPHLATLIERLRAERGPDKTLLMDGGDTWQGSGTAYWTRGRDMVDACNLLGVDVMTGHWEYTYKDTEVLANIERFNGEFVAQNVRVKEDALFDGYPAYDEDTGHAHKPYTIKVLGGVRVAVVGQSFPYTPIANPQRFIPNWTFGIQDEALQELVNEVRDSENPDVVVLLSHNGMDVDLKLASRVTGIDAIFGGHTHDGMPRPSIVSNASGQTLVTNAGSNGKYLGVMDLDVRDGKVQGYRYKLMPVFSNYLEEDADMRRHIESVRAPFLDILNEKLAVADELLYRRGHFNGPFDQIICDALIEVLDGQISLSPGFRWGTTVLPGQAITMEHVLDQTCMTYPETYVREMSGEQLKLILEDVADNLFNPDPYFQQGGDMVRVGGFNYEIDPTVEIGRRISNMRLNNGELIDASRNYKVAGWATVGSVSPGRPVWDEVADYLRDRKVAKITRLNTPVIRNIDQNPGLEAYRQS